MAGVAFNKDSRTLTFLLVTVFCFCFMAGAALAQSVEATHNTMRKSLVYLKASGIGASGAATGVPQEATGTGFLVSDDGFILTTYHLLSKLGDVVPETVKIEANIGAKVVVFDIIAAPVNAVPELDLLMLKIPPGIDPYIPVKLGSLSDANSASDVLTSGFNKTVNYHKDVGSVGSKDTSSGYLWAVNDMPFAAGQSGSPVYTPEGVVIGVAKGQAIDSPDINYIIPIQLADSLLAHLRVAELQSKIIALEMSIKDLELKKVDPTAKQLEVAVQNIDEIGSNFEWTATVNAGEIEVMYHKLANSGPFIEKVLITAIPVVIKKDGMPEAAGSTFVDLDRDSDSDFLAPKPFNAAKRLGVISTPTLFLNVKNLFCNVGPAFTSDKIKLIIQPFLKDNVELDSKTVFVENILRKKVECDGNS